MGVLDSEKDGSANGFVDLQTLGETVRGLRGLVLDSEAVWAVVGSDEQTRGSSKSLTPKQQKHLTSNADIASRPSRVWYTLGTLL